MSLLLWAQSVMKAKAAAPAPARIEQVIQIPASSELQVSSDAIQWVLNNNRPAIDDFLKENAGDQRFFYAFRAIKNSITGGSIELDISGAASGDPGAGTDLSTAFETQGQIVIASGGSTLTIDMSDYSDDSDSYVLNGVTGTNAFVDAVAARAGAQAATLTLSVPATVPAGDSYAIAMTIDRTWGSGAAATPGAGGGNVQPKTFTHDSENWELWQVVPFLGSAVGGSTLGDCRIQLRNRDENRGSMQLADMPDRIVLSAESGQTADWTGLPWTFNRPSANSKFSNVGSGNSARKGIDYEPVHAIGASPTAVGIAQGETFTITLHWD